MHGDAVLNIPSHLIECPIGDATCVVNARGEVFQRTDAMRELMIFRLGGDSYAMDSVSLHNACLTPCKPKPVFVEAVAAHGIYKLGDCAGVHRKYVELQHAGSAVYFNTSDLAGIENIPTENLEIVLRVKKVSK